MKLSSTPVIWTIFFILVLAILAAIAYVYIEPREIVLNDSQAKIIGLKIAENEGVSRRLNYLSWPDGDEFASFGIAHFIWYPKDKNGLSISFNDLLAYISKSRPLPDWLINMKYPPWSSRENYFSTEHDVFKRQLSYFLQESISEQTQYLIVHLESTLPKILNEIKSPFAKMHVYENFYHVAMQENGVYVLLDYFLFKGDGISATERYNKQGWGLLQVLEHMRGNSDNLIQEFIISADLLLTRRIANAPGDEAGQLPLWRKRLDTYQLGDLVHK